MIYIFLGIALVAIIYFLIGFAVIKKNPSKSKNVVKRVQTVKCPVCQSQLYQGENIISKVYRPMNVPDQLMSVSGCPHCFPRCEPGIQRVCPVCHKPIAQDQTLTARLFNKTTAKKHVHILGCSNCHKSK